MTLRAPAPVIPGPVRLPAARTVRKVALCGSHSSSLIDAPWDDPSWEWWGHASSRGWYRRKMDRYFDLHPKACWSGGGKKGDGYTKWLTKNTVPIYMQKAWPEVPASIEYPKGRILMEFSDANGFFSNHAAWMIALALTEGVTTIGLFGINYGTEGEYFTQRGSAQYWLGRAAGMGVRIMLPSQCTLLSEPKLLYGYESHDETTGILKDAYKKRFKPQETIRPLAPGEIPTMAVPPPGIREAIDAEEKEFPRPEWALGPEPRTDGRAQA